MGSKSLSCHLCHIRGIVQHHVPILLHEVDLLRLGVERHVRHAGGRVVGAHPGAARAPDIHRDQGAHLEDAVIMMGTSNTRITD